MTALVGILNKRAVAIAADSAVTIRNQGNRKVLNTARMIFSLSEKYPVGVMIYSVPDLKSRHGKNFLVTQYLGHCHS